MKRVPGHLNKCGYSDIIVCLVRVCVCVYVCVCVHGIDAFPFYCPGARRGNIFVATWLLRPRPRSTSIVALYASSTVTMSRVLARFSVWSSIFVFFLMLRRPRCFVTTTVLFLTEFKKKKVRSQTVLLSGQ